MDERTNTFNRILKSHQERVLTMAQGTSPHELISGGQDGSILIWDLRTGKKMARHRVHESAITSVHTVGLLIFSGVCVCVCVYMSIMILMHACVSTNTSEA